MYTHQYERWEAERQQRATEDMIRMRQPVAPTRPVTVETADGWLVVYKALRTGSVVPPYQYQYCHDHFRDIVDAETRIYELEAGDWQGWSFVALVACKGGVPLGCKKVLP